MKPRIKLIGNSPLQPLVWLWECGGAGTTGIYTAAKGYSPSVAYYAWLSQQVDMTINRAWAGLFIRRGAT